MILVIDKIMKQRLITCNNNDDDGDDDENHDEKNFGSISHLTHILPTSSRNFNGYSLIFILYFNVFNRIY